MRRNWRRRWRRWRRWPLELAAGAGDTGFEVAKALGDDSQLISTDFARWYLDWLDQATAAAGPRSA